MPGIEYSDSHLLFDIQALTSDEASLLARYVKISDIHLLLAEMKEQIALEAKNRIQSKIALFLNHGYGSGALFNSIYYKIEGGQIVLSSTKNYFEILNRGFSAFDMKEALAGKRVRMRLPGGGIIYRTVGPNEQKVVKPGQKRNKIYASNHWIHPGFHGVHIYELVADEMKVWIQDYVRGRIRIMLDIAKGRAADSFGQGKEIFAQSPSGKFYYNVRNNKGQFMAGPSDIRNLIRHDLLQFPYRQHGAMGAHTPMLGRFSKLSNRRTSSIAQYGAR